MIRPILRIAGHGLATILTGATVLAGFAVWRLSEGPVQVDGLGPHLEEALSTDRMTVSVGRTRLAWQGWQRPLAVTADDVELVAPDGRAIAHLQHLNVRLDGRRLAGGRVAVRSATLDSPVLHVLRDEDGAFSIAVGGEPQGAGSSEDGPDGPDGQNGPDGQDDGLEAVGLADFLGGLRDPYSPADPLAGIHHLSVIDGVIEVDDRWLGVRWQAEDADIDLRRNADTVFGQVSLAIPFDDGGEARASRQSAEFQYDFDSGRTRARLDFANLVPSALASRHPLLAPLSAIQSVFEGTVEVDLDEDLQAEQVRFSARGGAGRIDMADLYERAMTVAAVTVEGEADLARRALTLDTIAIDLGGPQLSASAEMVDRDGNVDVRAEFDLANLPVDLIDQYWPPTVEPGGRAWVTENISLGFVRTLHGRISGQFPIDDPGEAEITVAEGDLTLDGAAVRYLPALPIVQNMSGTGHFDMNGLTLDVGGGHSLDLRVPEAMIVIDYSATPETIDIDVDITGPLATVLAVLDRPGIEYTRTVGLDPERVSGTSSGRLRLTFPLVDSLTMDEIALAAAANVADADLGEMFDGMAVHVQRGTLELDGRGMAVTGVGALNGVAAAFDWRERFDGAAERTRLTVTGTMDDDDRLALGLPDTPALRGPVGTEVVLLQSGGGQSLTADLDLSDAEVAIDALDWAKPAGIAGAAHLVARWGGDGSLSLQDIAVDAADLSVRGSVVLRPEASEVERAEIVDLAWRDNRLHGTIARTEAGGYDIAVGGSYFDASDLMDALFDGDDANEEVSDPGTPLDVRLDLDRVLLAEDRELRAVTGSVANDGREWIQADLAALSTGGGPLTLQLRPAGEGGFALRIAAGDAGDMLAAFGLLDSVNGGRLSLDASRENADGPIHGTLTASEFRLRQAPIMARLLAALSLSGLSDLLNTDGIGFEGATADLTLDGDRLTIADGLMAGGSLGLTVEGVVDLAEDTLDTEGTIVPVYGVNRVIGEIPLLGDLLTGGEGEGILAFNYAITGPLDNPQVAVNPLSVLAPGVLRDLFLFDARPSDPNDWPDNPQSWR